MQELDPDSLFSIFNKTDDEVLEEHGVIVQEGNPYLLIGELVKNVNNYYLIDQMYVRKEHPKYKSYRSIIKKKVYDRFYDTIQRILKCEINSDFKLGEMDDSQDVIYCLEDILYFYESIEEYEKCAIIFKCISRIREIIVERIWKTT